MSVTREQPRVRPPRLSEAVLLARALLGSEPRHVEERFLVKEAWRSAGLPDRNITVHVTVRYPDEPLDDFYIAINEHGQGRFWPTGERPPGAVRELSVLAGSSPAVDYFASLHRQVAAHARCGSSAPSTETAIDYLFVDNAARTIRYGRPDEPRPELVQLSEEFRTGGMVARWDLDRAATATAELEMAARDVHITGRADSWTAAAMLGVARLARAFIDASDPPPEFARSFTFGMLELGVSPWQALYGPPRKAIRDGHHKRVLEAAAGCLREAEIRKEEALDGPPDREAYSRMLFSAVPYALAARFAVAALSESQARTTETDQLATTSEELFVRLQDGLIHQWLDFDHADLRRERHLIMDAQRRHDSLAVNLLLREGEWRLLRPRAYRRLLLGEVPWPDFQEVRS